MKVLVESKFIQIFKGNVHHWMTLLFLFLLTLVSAITLTLHDSASITLSYLLFPLLICIAKFARVAEVKNIAAIAALLAILILGIMFPADVEEIEEGFILIPLLYILIFPHSLWPISVSFLLLLTYLPSLEHYQFVDFMEDCIEIVIIASFATVMSFYQYKTKIQSLYFKAQSLTDDLTQVPNRKAFNQDLLTNFQRWRQSPTHSFALMLIDLDNFKRINDQYGHEVGDQQLAELAYRYEQCFAGSASLYRLGGDEFCILLVGDKGKESLYQSVDMLLSKIYSSSNVIYKLKSSHQSITPSVGISMFPYDTEEVEELLRNADLAMYSSKGKGKNSFAFFKQEMFVDAIKRYQIEQELKTAIEKEQFYLVYQPKVCVKTGVVKGVEALIRWQHPQLGTINPADFIPIAESSGMIIPIGRWVLHTACSQLVHWHASNRHFYIAVNISAVQVQQSDLVTTVSEIVSQTGVDPNWLEFELTETAIMEAPELYVETFESLKALGIRIAIDDFGIAYSSLAYLTKLPIDTLKIDKSFVDHCVENHQDRMIVRTIVQLSNNLGLTSVAEGVETEEQRIILEEEGVDRFQGYLFSKPVLEEDLIEILF